MSLRVALLYLLAAIIFSYAWKDWFVSVCGLILVTAIMGHEDFPESLGGIQGLNLWNILFADIFLAWLMNRRHEGHFWDMPKCVNVLLVLWLGVVLVGWIWMAFDRRHMTETVAELVSDQFINTIKWPLVGLLLFDGCRTRHRVKVALVCTSLFFGLIALQIVKAVPLGVVTEPGNVRARKQIPEDVGISPNGAGKMMSGAPWAMLALIAMLRTGKYKLLLTLLAAGASIVSLIAIGLSGSRSAYVASVVTIVLLCFMRWRRALLLVPLGFVIMPVLLPGATARMLAGFGEKDVSGQYVTNQYNITSGRTEIWPPVAAKILESPVFGFGREAMRRTGLRLHLFQKWGESQGVAVAHPHNAYLQVLLDSGIIGFFIIVGLHIVILVYAASLFRVRGDPLFTATGGFALAILTGHLTANMGGQSFYPTRIDFGLWCAIGVMLRMHVARSNLTSNAAQESPYITVAAWNGLEETSTQE